MTLQLDRVTYLYGKKTAVDQVTVALSGGKFYGILGPNGSGKTTLLDLMVRTRQPDSGQVRFEGKDLSQYSRRDLARQFALVPQQYNVNFPFTAREIVIMGRYPHTPRFSAPDAGDLQMVDEVMNATGVAEFGERLITELSGGERQRVIIARALAQDTPVLLLDEATSNLDIHHAIGLLNLVSDRVCSQGKTVISVFHDINLAATFCDELLFLKNGRLESWGTVDQTLTEKTVRHIFQVDARVSFEPFAGARQVVFRR